MLSRYSKALASSWKWGEERTDIQLLLVGAYMHDHIGFVNYIITKEKGPGDRSPGPFFCPGVNASVRSRHFGRELLIGLVLRHLDDPAADMALAIAIGEVDHQPEPAPDRQHEHRLGRQVEVER